MKDVFRSDPAEVHALAAESNAHRTGNNARFDSYQYDDEHSQAR